jgi:UDP-N-acetylglucosamine--N-acetylmuramyl-(pentapeptide) pyrophosphoryl-undecaprenol N-acetylglucosamine transferase
MKAPREVRVALAGGGSGGHLFPGLAVARSMLPEGHRPMLYGSGRAGEGEWVGERAETIALDAPMLPSRGKDVPRYLARLSRAVHCSMKEMRTRRPDVVVGLGGYASVAPGLAALLLGRPLILLEQNVVPGKANLLLSRLGGTLAATWPASLTHLTNRARKRARVLGNPVRPELFLGRRNPEKFGLRPDRPILLVMGGSQGAEGVNRRVAAAAGVFAERGLQLLWLTGPRDRDLAGDALRSAGVRAFVSPFSDDMGTVFRTADLVLSRSGGTTVAELAALGRPSVLVPYPHHKDCHQEYNARALVSAGGARLVREAELTLERITGEVVDLCFDREALSSMGRAAASVAVPDAAGRVARFAFQMMTAGRR